MDNNERLLHFDVSLGCTAEAIIAALTDLTPDTECIRTGFEACGIKDAFATFRPEKSVLVSTRAKRRPFWARSKVSKTSKVGAAVARTTAWLTNENVTLTEMRSIVESSDLHPISQALALKAVKILIDTYEKSSGMTVDSKVFKGEEATRMLCQIVTFAQLLSNLNPSSVTASRVAMSIGDKNAESRGWLYALSEEVPVLDRTWPAPYADCVGLALLLSVTSRFGARGESIIERHGVGTEATSAQPQNVVRALLCHVPSIASRSVSTSNNEVLPQVEITAVLGQSVDVADLIRRLHGLGMRQVYTWQVFEASTFPRVMLRGILPYAPAETAIEAILVTGEAIELSTQSIETQKLHQRTVSVPFGRGQKMQACRVTEWLWSGKVLRADPDPADLALLVQATGFAQDVLRADILAAWRQFRRPI